MPFVTTSDGRRIDYTIERKDVRNLNLRIRPDGSVFASANRWVPEEKIQTFVQSRVKLIAAAQDRLARSSARPSLPETIADGTDLVLLGAHLRVTVMPAARARTYIAKNELVLETKTPQDAAALHAQADRFLSDLAAQVFEKVCRGVYPYFEAQGVAYPTVKVRQMKSRWGSCIKTKGIVTLNRQLIHAPLPCIEYVAAHEFCHLIHPDHSRRFYTLLEKLMPDYRRRKAFLDGGRDIKENNR